MSTWQPHRSSLIYTTHSSRSCSPAPCCVHRPSAHHMRDWPQNYREDTGVTERICPHGVGHPDPDQPFEKDAVQWMHGCDGCCTPPAP